MSQEETFINGDLLRLRREASGWVLNDLATRACMSVKQIRQLEEGGLSSYYSQAVKITAAKKVGAILGLSPEEVLTPPSDLSQAEIQIESVVAANADIEKSSDIPQINDHRVAHADEDSEEISIVSNDSGSHLPIVDDAPKKTKTSLWLIAALFVFALVVAAYMQPQDEPLVEAAPPLQALPTEVAEPASAASAADVSASSAEVVALPASAVVVNVQKPSSTATLAASSARVVLPAASSVAPVMALRSASASTALPAASNASKAP
jgi:transcriptional regulator with XRE-family HTH domain